MEHTPEFNVGKEFESYEINHEDFEVVTEETEQLFKSSLLEPETLKNLRVTFFDSKNFYILTNGGHKSSETVEVEELPITSKADLRMYKVPHGEEFGKDVKDYKGGHAWFESPELEETAVGAEKVLNPKTRSADTKTPILKTILLPPPSPFERLHGNRYDYKTDLLFHEAAHIEEMLIRDWPNKGEILPFPREKDLQEFSRIVESSAFIPPTVSGEIMKKFDRATLGEMYAMLVDREAKRQYIPQQIRRDDEEFDKNLEQFAKLGTEKSKDKVSEALDSSHKKGYILARILEKQIPDYKERKNWIRKLMVS